MRSPFGITTTGPAPQPGVLCALQATRAAVALSAGVIAVRAFRSSISGRSTVAPLTPCACNAATKAAPWAAPGPVSGVSVEVGALIASDRGGMGGMTGHYRRGATSGRTEFFFLLSRERRAPRH